MIFELAVHDMSIHTAQFMFAIQCKITPRTMLCVLVALVVLYIIILADDNVSMGGFFVKLLYTIKDNDHYPIVSVYQPQRCYFPDVSV